MKVRVVGAGIVGCPAAYHLARAGHAVHRTGADRPATGSAMRSAGALRPA